jgi:hypothetical protein
MQNINGNINPKIWKLRAKLNEIKVVDTNSPTIVRPFRAMNIPFILFKRFFIMII